MHVRFGTAVCAAQVADLVKPSWVSRLAPKVRVICTVW